MKTKTAVVAALATLLAASPPALADRGRDERGHRERVWASETGRRDHERRDRRNRWDGHGVRDHRRWVRHDEPVWRPPWSRHAGGVALPGFVTVPWPGPLPGVHQTLGVWLGALVGGTVGHAVDPADHVHLARALEVGPTLRVVAWQNPTTRVRYEVEPTATYDVGGGRYRREYRARVLVGGVWRELHGTACRQPDGTWEVVR